MLISVTAALKINTAFPCSRPETNQNLYAIGDSHHGSPPEFQRYFPADSDTGMVEEGGKKVADNQAVEHPRLWINYPYIDKEERDFSYLVPQLKNANIDVVYDSFRMMSDTHLWARVVPRLISIGFDGWMYILTHQCFTRRAYTDELTAAIDQVTNTWASVPDDWIDAWDCHPECAAGASHAPLYLPGRSRRKAQLSDVLRKRMRPERKERCRRKHAIMEDPSLLWRRSFDDGGRGPLHGRTDPVLALRNSQTAIRRDGAGAVGRAENFACSFAEARGTGRHEGRDITWFGAANTISDTESAYAVFLGPLPDFICFGPAKNPFGPPGSMEIMRPGLLGKTSGIH